MEKYEELVNYLSKLADKYQFSDKEISDLQSIIEEIYNGPEDEEREPEFEPEERELEPEPEE